MFNVSREYPFKYPVHVAYTFTQLKYFFGLNFSQYGTAMRFHDGHVTKSERKTAEDKVLLTEK
jgi:hypothetical protein